MDLFQVRNHRPLRISRAAQLLALLTVLMLVVGQQTVRGRGLLVRPLSAGEVYRLLHSVGRDDAVPEGRVITQGLAAMKGFALGLTKGIGGSLLFDIITANITGNSNANNGGTTTQEICFNSRSARSLREADEIADAYLGRGSSQQRGRQGRRGPHRRLKKFSARAPEQWGRQATATTTNTATPTVTATATGNTTPTTTATTGGTGTGTTGNTGGNTGTATQSTTTTGNRNSINCIVIQKPAAG